MNNPNIKIYLGISFALIMLLILVLIIPFAKKSTIQNSTTNSTGQPFPTSVQINPSPVFNTPTPVAIKDVFTGVKEEQLPQQVVDLATQKKDLRQKTPLSLSAFTIDFDYGEDKFVVTLKDPKDQTRREFENWKTSNYPGLGSEQFNFR